MCAAVNPNNSVIVQTIKEKIKNLGGYHADSSSEPLRYLQDNDLCVSYDPIQHFEYLVISYLYGISLIDGYKADHKSRQWITDRYGVAGISQFDSASLILPLPDELIAALDILTGDTMGWAQRKANDAWYMQAHDCRADDGRGSSDEPDRRLRLVKMSKSDPKVIKIKLLDGDIQYAVDGWRQSAATFDWRKAKLEANKIIKSFSMR